MSLLCFTGSTATTTTERSKCPDGFHDFITNSSFCYTSHIFNRLNPDEARDDCENRNASLIQINSEEENNELLNVYANYDDSSNNFVIDLRKTGGT